LRCWCGVVALLMRCGHVVDAVGLLLVSSSLSGRRSPHHLIVAADTHHIQPSAYWATGANDSV